MSLQIARRWEILITVAAGGGQLHRVIPDAPMTWAEALRLAARVIERHKDKLGAHPDIRGVAIVSAQDLEGTVRAEGKGGPIDASPV